eukprot:888118-Rhodomonas_salina.1
MHTQQYAPMHTQQYAPKHTLQYASMHTVQYVPMHTLQAVSGVCILGWPRDLTPSTAPFRRCLALLRRSAPT